MKKLLHSTVFNALVLGTFVIPFVHSQAQSTHIIFSSTSDSANDSATINLNDYSTTNVSQIYISGTGRAWGAGPEDHVNANASAVIDTGSIIYGYSESSPYGGTAGITDLVIVTNITKDENGHWIAESLYIQGFYNSYTYYNVDVGTGELTLSASGDGGGVDPYGDAYATIDY